MERLAARFPSAARPSKASLRRARGGEEGERSRGHRQPHRRAVMSTGSGENVSTKHLSLSPPSPPPPSPP
eukprot:1881986-Rhodomonas_salina.1